MRGTLIKVSNRSPATHRLVRDVLCILGVVFDRRIKDLTDDYIHAKWVIVDSDTKEALFINDKTQLWDIVSNLDNLLSTINLDYHVHEIIKESKYYD